MKNSLVFIVSLCFGLCFSFPQYYKNSILSNASPTEFPWTVMVLSKTYSNYKLCGGVLIKPNAVLTAAHCVIGRNASQLVILAGVWDVDNKSPEYPRERRYVSKIIVHDGYNKISLRNNYAILILHNRDEKKTKIDFICVANQNDIETVLKHNVTCSVTGWGRVGNELSYRHIMKKVEMNILDQEQCASWYYDLQKDSICAGRYGEKLVGEGDSGSPLICQYPRDHSNRDNLKILVGIYSFRDREAPGIYMNVATVRDWIEYHLSKNHLGYNTACS